MATGKKSRLAEIYLSEIKKGGSVASALGKAAAEKLDIRQMFDQKGFLAAAFPAMFKAYKAPGGKKMQAEKIKKLSPQVSGDYGQFTQELVALTSQMHDVAVNSTIIAKNTMVLPAMAKDTNIIRQNIAKLVKIQGDKASEKPDSFFASQKERENAYESKFKKETKQQKAPGTTTQVGNKVPTPPSPLQEILVSLAGSLEKGVGLAALGVGIGGFFAGLALGGAAVSKLGGTEGVKTMLVSLAEGLQAFDSDSFIRFSALLGTGALFGAMTGLKTKGGAMLGMGAIGTGIGLFFSGLSIGGALGDMIGNSAGIKEMMVNFAEGLAAFDPGTLSEFNTLLAVGGIFGAVAGAVGPAGAAVAGGATIGMGLIGTGIGLFLSGIAVGDKLIELITGGSEPGSGIKSLLTNISDGLKSFSGTDSSALLGVAKALPLLGAGMIAYFGESGVAGIINAVGGGFTKFMNFIFGNENKSPMQKLAEDMKSFNVVNGDNLSKIGQGFKDLVSGVQTMTQTPPTTPTSGNVPLPAGVTPSNAGAGRGGATTDSRRLDVSSGGSFGNIKPLPNSEMAESKPTNDPLSQITAAGLKVRPSGDVYQGGVLTNATVGIAKTIQEKVPGFRYFTGLNDVFHQKKVPGSDHTKGNGLDFVLGAKPSPEQSQSIKNMLMQIPGVRWVGNEYYKKPIGDANENTTGGHFHVSTTGTPSMSPNTTSSGNMLAEASTEVSNSSRDVSAPIVNIVAPTKDAKQVASTNTPIASTVDLELARKDRMMSRQTSLTS